MSEYLQQLQDEDSAKFPTLRDKIYHARHLYRVGLKEPFLESDQRRTRSGRNPLGFRRWRPKCDAAIAILSRAGIEEYQFLLPSRLNPVAPILSVQRFFALDEARFKPKGFYKTQQLKSRAMLSRWDRGKPHFWMYQKIVPKGKLP